MSVNSGSSNTDIEYNTIDGNTENGIEINGSSDVSLTTNNIQNNDLDGVYISTTSNNISLFTNGIIANAQNGVASYVTSGLTIFGNIIHTNTQYGIRLNGGSDSLIDSNIIYDNFSSGTGANISLNAASLFGIVVDDISIAGNKIGVQANGNIASNNPTYGIVSSGDITNLTIGGINTTDSNEIAGHGNMGISVLSGDLQVVPAFIQANKVSILGNSIHDNNSVDSGLGIDLYTGVELGMPDGVFNSYTNLGPDANDPGDTDTGSNSLINFPVINSADQNNLNLSVNFDLDALDSPTNQYRIEFFSNDTADPSGYGEGQTYLGFVTVSPGNNQIANLTLPANTNLTGKVLSATTTAIDGTTASGFGSTSEFSLASSITVSSLPTNNNTTNYQNQTSTNLANAGDSKIIRLVLLSVVMIVITLILMVHGRRHKKSK